MQNIKKRISWKKKIMVYSMLLLLMSCVSDDKKFNNLDEILSTANYDTSKIPAYTLPAPLVCEDGTIVTNDSLWWNKRRPELLNIFEEHMYGRIPGSTPDTMIFEVQKIKNNALDGKAIMKEVNIYFTTDKDIHSTQVLLYIPKDIQGPVPCFMGLNFYSNISISEDSAISMPRADRWIKAYKGLSTEQKHEDMIRGYNARRWPLGMIIDSGYALATAYYGDFDPDYDDGFNNGLHPLFYKEGQSKPDSNEWGAIGVWAWGMSRILDYLETDSFIDAKKVIAFGHSRLGKTALWAGAQDQRFAIVISNNSGFGGAALSKRKFGETAYILNEVRPHWFCNNFTKYNNKEELLPMDQHELLALIAPRPVYVASASEDLPADPKGEFLSAFYADTVYKFLGTEGLKAEKMPGINQPVSGTMGYHLRQGKHDMLPYDWKQYIKFANQHFLDE